MVVRSRRGYVIAAVLVVAALAVTGAALAGRERPAGGSAEPTPASPVPVVVPGRPGETAAIVPSDQLPAAGDGQYNASDVWFVRMMIPHHGQALELAALAPERAASPRVRAFAERISVAQGPEITVLRTWLAARDLPEDESGHAHDEMPGMQPAAAIEALAASTGEEFDRLFVDMMSDHHQGAVDMATDVLGTGEDPQVQQLASAIAVEQAVEIDRLHDLLPG